jgi:hypothetical protein
MSETHYLKVWPLYFGPLASWVKSFEVRTEDDRRFEVNDVLVLREWDPALYLPKQDPGQDAKAKEAAYTGRKIFRRVCYVLRDGVSYKDRPAAVLGLADCGRG